jgi:hypothetical protein
MSTRQLLPLIGALFALYIIWGSTYFAIAIGVASWPPLMIRKEIEREHIVNVKTNVLASAFNVLFLLYFC